MKKFHIVIAAVLVLLVAAAAAFFLTGGPEPPSFTTVKVARHDIRVAVSTNGIIEPADRSEIYAPIDGFVVSIRRPEGADIERGQLLLQLKSEQVRAQLAEANAALLAARREARTVETGPSREELAAIDASIAESALQLEQQNKDLAVEEALYQKQATSRAALENLRKERDLTQLRVESLNRRRGELLARYSAEEKEWEQGRIGELSKQVESLKRQLDAEAVPAPKTGRIFSLEVKEGAFVSKGQLLARIYQPGAVRLRAYVDEPDLGRVREGQPVRIEWDGLPDTHWTGVVEKQAERVVAMNNRSIGEVLCSIDSGPEGLIPNLNVRVEIITDAKRGVLSVPRTALFNHGGKPSVMILQGATTRTVPVDLGLVTADEVEILGGIREGDLVVVNPK